MSLSKYVNKMNQEMLVPDSPKCNCEDEVVVEPEVIAIDDSIEDIDDAQEEITEFLEESGEPIEAKIEAGEPVTTEEAIVVQEALKHFRYGIGADRSDLNRESLGNTKEHLDEIRSISKQLSELKELLLDKKAKLKK